MPERKPLADALREDVLIFDGPMGTELYRRHVFTNRCFDELSLSDPKLIRKIHSDYCDVGADVLTTNTFGANRVTLARFGLAEKLKEIHVAGARLAREAADECEDRPIWVVGSIGPLPKGPGVEEDPATLIIEQVEALVEGGVDAIIFETLPSRHDMELCALAMKRLPDVPFILSLAVDPTGESAAGEPISRLFAPLGATCATPIALGMNCGSGPDGLLESAEKAIGMNDLPMIIQPNAGMPKEVDNRRIYLCSPEYLTTYAQRFINLGVSAIGGCCGTTPDHIREIAKSIKPLARSRTRPKLVEAAAECEEKPMMPLRERSRFASRLARGQWVTSVELVPPRGYDLSPIIEKCKRLHRNGVDAINIPDGPRASSRISPLIVAEHIQREANIEVILHFCCRDRNLIGMQADLLACAACEIRNILFVTGDPPKMGNYPDASGVFDTDSIGMAAVQNRMNRGIDIGGQPIDPPTRAVIGVGLDPTAIDRKRELDRFRQKIEAGAEFAITQPVFDPEALLRFLDEVGPCDIPIVAGVWPLASYRNALFLQNEVPGVEIPESIMARMEAVESREDQLKLGVEIAREAVDRIRERVAGIQVSAPFGNVNTALAVIGSVD